MDTEVEFMVVKANLLAQGLFAEDDNGIRITGKGEEVAYDRWMQLNGEDRLLFGCLIKTQLKGEDNI